MDEQARLHLDETTIGSFLNQLAARSPTPGGGSVASVTGMLAASLIAMVINYTIGKAKYAQHEPQLKNALDSLARCRTLLAHLADEDVATYGAMNELMALPEGDPRRAEELPPAALAATQVPLTVAATACDLLRLCETLATITNRMLRSDLEIGAILARACVEAACCNVMINLPTLARCGLAGGISDEAARLVANASALEADIRRACR